MLLDLGNHPWYKGSMKTMDLKVGTRVMALCDLDPHGANVSPLERGYVMQEKTRSHDFRGQETGPTFGPLVVWDEGGVCNVYKGQVAVLPADAEKGLSKTWKRALERMGPKLAAAYGLPRNAPKP